MPSLEFVFLSRLFSWARCGSRLYRFLIIAFSICFGFKLSLREQDRLEDDSSDGDAMALVLRSSRIRSVMQILFRFGIISSLLDK